MLHVIYVVDVGSHNGDTTSNVTYIDHVTHTVTHANNVTHRGMLYVTYPGVQVMLHMRAMLLHIGIMLESFSQKLVPLNYILVILYPLLVIINLLLLKPIVY